MPSIIRLLFILIILLSFCCTQKSNIASTEDFKKRQSLSYDGYQIGIYLDKDWVCYISSGVKLSYPQCKDDSVVWYRATNSTELKELFHDKPGLERLQYWQYSGRLLPDILKEFKNLKELHLSNLDTLENIDIIEALTTLEKLDLWLSRTKNFELNFSKFKNLKQLKFKADLISEFPLSIYELEKLEYLELDRFYNIKKTNLDGLCNLENLIDLRVKSPNFVLPEIEDCLIQLKALEIGAYDIMQIPSSIKVENLINFSLRSGYFDFNDQYNFRSLEYAYLHNYDYLKKIKFGNNFKAIVLRVDKIDSFKLDIEVLNKLEGFRLLPAKPLLNFPDLKNSNLKTFKTSHSNDNLVKTIGKDHLSEYILKNDR